MQSESGCYYKILLTDSEIELHKFLHAVKYCFLLILPTPFKHIKPILNLGASFGLITALC